MPEEKTNHSPHQAQPPGVPAINTTPAEPYRRVYPEWKPSSTLEKTDVVGTIEALAGMTCKYYFLKDCRNELMIQIFFRCPNTCPRQICLAQIQFECFK